ncbi:MAG: quinolinate synthase NadA [Candidatus Thermoplasmatota archaeon]|nr:quinolinate synthase NadA [Candidatus Thermoplasmatota archaeon]
MDTAHLIENIRLLKDRHNAIILAHNYQIPEVQDVADVIGDSLDLAQQAAKTNAEYIIFCGVDFMAESAKILNPEKTVIHPSTDAQCPMAAMVDAELLGSLKEEHPQAAVVAYINTTAKVKAIADICCTSSNGAKVVNSLPHKEIIFVPDRNLGRYVERTVTEKTMILWPGICSTHHNITTDDIATLKQQHPGAEVLVHPECTLEVIDCADHAFSTNGMVNHAKTSESKEFIIGTEKDLCYRLKKENPTKEFYPIPRAICPAMKKITLEKVLNSLETLEPRIRLPQDIMKRAVVPLKKMMDVGRGD